MQCFFVLNNEYKIYYNNLPIILPACSYIDTVIEEGSVHVNKKVANDTVN